MKVNEHPVPHTRSAGAVAKQEIGYRLGGHSGVFPFREKKKTFAHRVDISDVRPNLGRGETAVCHFRNARVWYQLPRYVRGSRYGPAPNEDDRPGTWREEQKKSKRVLRYSTKPQGKAVFMTAATTSRHNSRKTPRSERCAVVEVEVPSRGRDVELDSANTQTSRLVSRITLHVACCGQERAQEKLHRAGNRLFLRWKWGEMGHFEYS